MNTGAALAVFFTLGWVLLYVCRAESVPAALPFYSRSERPWVVLTSTILTGHATAACLMVTWTPVIPLASAALAVVAFVAAIAFWLWARVEIGGLQVRCLPNQPPQRFRRDGAFGIVRHPLYLGHLLAAGAPLLVACRAFLLGTLTLSFVMLAVRAVQEERRLHAQLGPTYEMYCRDVKRLIPFVW